MDNIKSWTGLSVEESIRMTEDRDKWRKYVHGVANPDNWHDASRGHSAIAEFLVHHKRNRPSSLHVPSAQCIRTLTGGGGGARPGLIFTERCYASAVLAMALCMSVRPSITSRSSTKRPNIGSHKTPHDIPGTLVFWSKRSPRNSTGITPYGGAKCRWGGS